MLGDTLKRSTLDDPRSLICSCGNDSSSLGFKPSTLTATAPLAAELENPTHLLCLNCFSLIDPTSDTIIDTASTQYAFEEWELSPGSDCDSCGYSENKVTFYRRADGNYTLRASVGCTTEHLFLLSELEQLFTYMQRFEYYNEEMKRELLISIEDYKAKVGS